MCQILSYVFSMYSFIQSGQRPYRVGTNYFLFTDENTKAKRGCITSLKPQNKK